MLARKAVAVLRSRSDRPRNRWGPPVQHGLTTPRAGSDAARCSVVIRKAAVAGSWYPGSAGSLARAVDDCLEFARESEPGLGSITAIVAPHAGLMYSGRVAAYAYRALQGQAFDLALLVGPSHFVAFGGVATAGSAGFETPLGVVVVDEECEAALADALPGLRPYPVAHAREHSLEMQLPFLQRVAPSAKIVALLMGHQTAETSRSLGEALAAVVRGRRVVLVASTDLSHYHDARTAVALDAVVVDHIARMDAAGLQRTLETRPDHACGGGPTVAVLRAARLLGAERAAILRYGDSGDVSGDKSSVVGYVAAAIGA